MKPGEVQIVRMPANVGETTTLRVTDKNLDDSSVRFELLITTPGGSVIAVPVASGAEIRLTAGADVSACKVDLVITGDAQVPPTGELH